MNKVEISVIVPAYNRADLLPRTICSAVEQTVRPYEIIIVDDESPDNTPSVCQSLIEEYNDQVNIIYIRHEKNKGEGGARNTGILAAKGNYIAFLDSDDEWLPDRLEKQINYINQTGVAGVFCESFLVENNDYQSATHIRIMNDRIVSEHLLTQGCGYGVGTNLLIARDAMGDDIFDESMRLFIDLDWLYRISERENIDILHTPLTYYHKAPMRSGDYIKKHVDIFLQKYEPLLKSWSFFNRLKVYACMNWYVAHAYLANGNYLAASRYFFKGIFQSPIRHPGNYFNALSYLAKGLIAGRTAP
jgi:glycosyltransferase involved in cell wall biosynthesis